MKTATLNLDLQIEANTFVPWLQTKLDSSVVKTQDLGLEITRLAFMPLVWLPEGHPAGKNSHSGHPEKLLEKLKCPCLSLCLTKAALWRCFLLCHRTNCQVHFLQKETDQRTKGLTPRCSLQLMVCWEQLLLTYFCRQLDIRSYNPIDFLCGFFI